MKSTAAFLAILLLLTACTSAKPAPGKTDPTGKWSGDYGSSPSRRDDVTLELKFENSDLTGVVRAGPRSLPLSRASFMPETGAITMEFDTQSNNGQTVHYIIEGKVDGNTMTGSWSHDAQRGDFHVTRQ
jgi:hypothetical protein